MTDILAERPKASWRGIPLPVVQRSVENSHGAVMHVAEYKNGRNIELSVGGQDVFRYKLAASENLLPAHLKHWFTLHYNEFIRAYKDRSPGTLVDPGRGLVTCKPITLVEDWEATRRDGPTFDVAWAEHTPIEEGDDPLDTSSHGIVYASAEIDREIATIPWSEGNVPQQLTSAEVEWTEADPPEPTINPIDAVTGVLRQGEFLIRRSTAVFEDTSRRLEKLHDAIDDLDDPHLYRPLQAKTRRARLQTLKAQQRFESGNRASLIKPLPFEMTLVEAANTYGLTVDEFLRLNPQFAKSHVVPMGAPIRHFQ